MKYSRGQYSRNIYIFGRTSLKDIKLSVYLTLGRLKLSKCLNNTYSIKNLQLNPTKIYKIPHVFIFFKKKFINFFKDSRMSIFANSIKFLPTPKS
jgi:hypothetical protein